MGKIWTWSFWYLDIERVQLLPGDSLIWYGCDSENITCPILNWFTWNKFLKICLCESYHYNIQNVQYIYYLPLTLPQFDLQKSNWNRTALTVKKTHVDEGHHTVWHIQVLEEFIFFYFSFCIALENFQSQLEMMLNGALHSSGPHLHQT